MEKQTVSESSHVEPIEPEQFAQDILEKALPDEMRSIAFSLVLQLADEAAAVRTALADDIMAAEIPATFRLAHQEDIGTICDMRCAQSVEYWDLAPSGDACRLFRAETEAFLSRTLNISMFFALVEREGEVVSMSGLEAADRLPMIGDTGGARHGATIVACYTPPLHRGRGYMRQMLSAWGSIAPMLGIDTLYMESHNPSMQYLASAAGYEHVSDKYLLSLPAADTITKEDIFQIREGVIR